MKTIRPKKPKGFTLVELMVTIAIAAIVLGVAIPSFSSTIDSNRLTTHANELVTALNLARSEAIKRGVQVTVRNKGASTHWESGWYVFVDSNGNNAFNDDGDSTLCESNADGSPSEDCLLKTVAALPSGYTITTGASVYKDYAAYMPSGLSKSSVGDTYGLCNSTASTTNSRTIKVNSSGRASVYKGTTSCP